MTLWKKSLGQRAAGWVRHTMTLLSPQYPVCLVCGHAARPSAGGQPTSPVDTLQLPQAVNARLCRACRSELSWIRSEEIQCYVCGRAEACEDCIRRGNGQILWNRSAVRYTDAMREWLADYKYRGAERLEPLLQNMLYALYDRTSAELRGQMADSRWKWDIVAFVPLSNMRLDERGFNQAERLAAALAGRYGLPLASLLVRTRDSGKQSHKDRLARMRAMEGLFAVEAGASSYLAHLYRVNGGRRAVRILLLDDIYTTGSTVHACASALHSCTAIPLQISVLTWARS
ncbi:ComF family protein [Paenibacillus daejeonensis]|uniref:ComF family protein n=1 Tax=Paenibacillus daejeonensis TaxID=135193 RepID=UPI000372BE04|nr:ComF family protein [Paenibacillus daejeonensis]